MPKLPLAPAVPPPPPRSKSESVSLRIDPKTKFMLEFVARIRGQSITTVVERAIRESADRLHMNNSGKNWASFWDAEEGVRTLQLLADSEYPSSYEEDELREFTKRNWPFFYTDVSCAHIRSGYVEILWPRISEFLETWRSTKASHYWEACEDMRKALEAAQVAPPRNWPEEANDDDEIKF